MLLRDDDGQDVAAAAAAGAAADAGRAPTRELGVAHVDWASDTEDIVKLEVWDVVDRPDHGPSSPSLALEHRGSKGAAAPAADAESVDVVPARTPSSS